MYAYDDHLDNARSAAREAHAHAKADTLEGEHASAVMAAMATAHAAVAIAEELKHIRHALEVIQDNRLMNDPAPGTSTQTHSTGHHLLIEPY